MKFVLVHISYLTGMSSHAFKQLKKYKIKFQSEYTYILLQGVINVTGRKQAHTSSRGIVNYGRDTNKKIN